tara:strand:+ start:1398 stop:1577 length:180 start_codon:yes stop_codon:yes gene_type:complete
MSYERTNMENSMEVFGLFGFIFSMGALYRIRNLEKKLKQFDVIPRDLDSSEDQKEAESE